MENIFIVIVYTENRLHMHNRIALILTRMKMDIESLTFSKYRTNETYKFTIAIKTTTDRIKMIVTQIEKLVEVVKVYYKAEGITEPEVKMQTDCFNDYLPAEDLGKVLNRIYTPFDTIPEPLSR